MAEKSDIIDQHLLEGERLMQTKLYDRAMVEFNKALKIDSEVTNNALEGLFHEAHATGNYEGVISIGTNMLLHNPNNSKLANLLGNSYRKQGNFVQADKLYEHCLKYDPNHRQASYNLAASMAKAELYDGDAISAVSPFESMGKPKLPDNQDGEKWLLNIQKEINADAEEPSEEEEEGGDWQEKLKKQMEELKDDNKKKEKKVRIEPEEIFPYIRKNKNLTPDEVSRLLLHLSIYSIENHYVETAWRALTRLSFKDKSENIQCFLALTYALRGEEDLAIEKILTLLSENPYNRYANVNVGYLYQQTDKATLARKYYILTHLLLEKSRGYYDMEEYRKLGEKYFQEGSYPNAQKIFEVLKEENETFEILCILGEIYIKQESFGKAIEIYRQIMKSYYDQPEVKEKMVEVNAYILSQARSLMDSNKYIRAAQMYEISLEIEPTKDVLENALTAYRLLKDDENIKRLTGRLREIEQREREQEIEASRIEKIKEARKFEAKALSYKAIQAYEEALRLKPEKEILAKLVALYKKTRQPDMVEDVSNRYQKMLEVAQRRAAFEAEEANS